MRGLYEIDGTSTTTKNHSTGSSSLLNNLDICAAILAEKPPKLPLREELNSLGFEVVLSAAGIGNRVSKDESERAVKQYRKSIAMKELKKRRFFPKSSTRIKQVLNERKRMEHELGLPHAVSYETYDVRLRSFDHANTNSSDNNSTRKRPSTASVGSDSDSKKNQRRWNMLLLRKRKKSKKASKSNKAATIAAKTQDGEIQSFEHLTSQAMFPDALVSSGDSSESSSTYASNTTGNDNHDIKFMNDSDSSSSNSEDFSTSLASTAKSGGNNKPQLSVSIPVVSQRTQALQQQNQSTAEGWDHHGLFNDTMEEDDDSSSAMGLSHQQQQLLLRSKLHSLDNIMNDDNIDTTSPLGQDMVPDVFGAFDMIDNESLQSSTVHATSRVRMDPDGTATTATVADTNATVANSCDPPTTVEALLLQYSMSDENNNKEYSSPKQSEFGGESYFQEEKKDEDEEVDELQHQPVAIDPMVLAFGNFVTSHPLDVIDTTTNITDDWTLQQYQPYETIQDVLNQADNVSFFPQQEHRIKLHDTDMEERIPVEDAMVLVVDDESTADDEIVSTAGTIVVPGTDVVVDDNIVVPIVDDEDLSPPPTPAVFGNEDMAVAASSPTMEQLAGDFASSSPPPPQQPYLQSTVLVDEIKSPMSAFERATAEILRVAGIEPTKGPLSTTENNNTSNNMASSPVSPESATMKVEKKNDADWMKSAKTVFDNFSTGVLKVAGIDTNTTEPVHQSTESPSSNNNSNVVLPRVSPTARTADIATLFESVVAFNVPVTDVETIISASPDLTQVRRNKDGRLPLHALCDRGMPDRSGFPIETLTDYLLKDVTNYQSLIYNVVDSYPPACLMQDKNFDLPVHLIARRLMEWEASWYELVYQKAAKERNASGATAIAITKLYQTMSTSIEKLLFPLVELSDASTLHCQSTGSMGTILPLHIASIFTVSVRCIRQILEAHPEAAAIPCDLGILHTFIPDECLPLELHDNLSTDSPKWEIDVSGTPLASDSDVPGEDGIRRSDLLFAYNPIEPHRLEKPRIRRLESRINYDALIVFGKAERSLDRAHQRVWVWMCSFREPDTGRPTYVNCVKRIISSLPIQSIRYLVSIARDNGEQLMDIASTECLKVIQMRLEQLYEIEKPMERKLSSEASVSGYEKELVGQLCRLVFNVPDAPFPTSFIILPYTLSQEADGSLRLASPESANIAFQFAECLLNLTDPRSILFILDAKSNDHLGQRLYDTLENSNFHVQERERVYSYIDSLLSLYEDGDAFLYLVDESTGLPRIDASSSVYPFVLTAPATLVHKLLPLMMMSMVQMRGEKAIPKLATVILDENVSFIPRSWSAASDLLIDHLTTPDTYDDELTEATEALRNFRSTCSNRFRMNETPRIGITEWNAELSLLKMLIEINDPERLYAGLTVMDVPEPTVCEESYFDAETQQITDRIVIEGNLSEEVDIESKNTSMVEMMQSYYPEHEVIDIIDLSRKMDALSELQLHLNRNTVDSPDETSPSFDDNDVLVGNTFSLHDVLSEEVDDNDTGSDVVLPRKNFISRYSLLFNDIASSQPASAAEPSDDENPTNEIRVWNAVDRMWEDVTFQLNSRTEIMYEDSQILQLKVALAEQAKKLSDLGKKVSHLKDEERRLTFSDAEFYDLTDFAEGSEAGISSRDSVSSARKLVIQMEDLEERLICNEIEIQHLSMEAFSVEHDGEKMVDRLRKAEQNADRLQKAQQNALHTPKKVSESTRETSGVSWGSGSTADAAQSRNSFLRYEKKVVRFNDDLTSVEFVESPEYTHHPKNTDVSTHILVLDDYANDSSWQYPIIELIDTAPSTPSTYNSSASESDIDPSGKVIYISASRDPEGSYLEPERSIRNAHVSVYSQDQRSSQALSGNSVASSDDKLSNIAVVTDLRDPVHSLFDAESSQTSEQSFNSTLLNILNAPTAENTLRNSLPSKNLSVRTEAEESKDSPSRFQKLMAVKRKKSEKSPRSAQIPVDANSNNSTKYKNYDRVFPNNNENAETLSTSSVYTSDAAIVEEVFRPATSITFSSPVQQREISAMSSDKSSSDIHSAMKVLEIERLITKYTSAIDAV